jgi:hypothetical protein
MSLIQEALKRQQQERDGTFPRADDPIPMGKPAPKPVKAGTPTPPPPPPPATTPDSGTAPAAKAAVPVPDLDAAAPLPDLDGARRPEKARAWKTLILITIAILLLGSGAVWMLAYALRAMRGRLESGRVPVQAAAPAASAPAKPAPLPSAAAAAPAVPEAETPPTAAPEPQAEPPSQAAADAVPAEAGSGPGTRPDAVERIPVNWPVLKLTGMIGRGQAGSAVINGQVVGIGDTVAGTKVIAIRSQGVELEYQGDRQVLKVGTAVR